MIRTAKAIFEKEGITRLGILPIESCEIILQRLLPDFAKSVIVFCVPYRTSTEKAKDGFSEYSRIKDYHAVINDIYSRIIPELSEKTGARCTGFADHSPINEKLAALKCGLGVVGRNSLFFDDVYGSFVFLGSIVTDAPCDLVPSAIASCINCQKCVLACPTGAILSKGIDASKCLSAISQKKQKTNEQLLLLKNNGIAWGCDICQSVCPLNKNAPMTPLKVFFESRTDHISYEFVNSLSKEDFSKFAFSYRGKNTVLENIKNIDENSQFL